MQCVAVCYDSVIPPYDRVISVMNESCHISMSYVTNEWVTSKHITATHTNLLQHTAAHCNALRHKGNRINDTKEKKRRGIMAQTRCAEPCLVCGSLMARSISPLCLLTDYNTLQHTTTRCNTLQHAATYTSCGKGYFERTATHCNPSPRAALQKKK